VTKLELIHADRSIIEEKKRLLERVEELHEFNQCSVAAAAGSGSTTPRSPGCQARAIFEAACDVTREGIRVHPRS